MSKQYTQLLESVKGPIQIFPTPTGVKWAWSGNQSFSPTVTQFWLENGLLVEMRPGVYVKASEHVEPKVCEHCGQVIREQEVANV